MVNEVPEFVQDSCHCCGCLRLWLLAFAERLSIPKPLLRQFDRGKDWVGAGPGVPDIEDLVDVARKHGVCPYYMAKDRSNVSVARVFGLTCVLISA